MREISWDCTEIQLRNQEMKFHLSDSRTFTLNHSLYYMLSLILCHCFQVWIDCYFNFLFLSIFYRLCYYSCPNFFLPFIPSLPCTLPSSSIPLHPQFISMGYTSKLFGFISYTILNLPLSNLCLPIMLLVSCTFSPPILPLSLPTDNPPCDVHFSESVPVLVICLVFGFVFQVQLLIVVNLLPF